MANLSDDRITEIAMTQIPSCMIERCIIEPEYRTYGVVKQKVYPDLPETNKNLQTKKNLNLIAGKRDFVMF